MQTIAREAFFWSSHSAPPWFEGFASSGFQGLHIRARTLAFEYFDKTVGDYEDLRKKIRRIWE
jgi:hypothetical protein